MIVLKNLVRIACSSSGSHPDGVDSGFGSSGELITSASSTFRDAGDPSVDEIGSGTVVIVSSSLPEKKCVNGPPSLSVTKESEVAFPFPEKRGELSPMPALLLPEDACCSGGDGGCSCLRLYALIKLLTLPWLIFIPCS